MSNRVKALCGTPSTRRLRRRPTSWPACGELNLEIDSAKLHTWDGSLIPEIVVTRQNPELPWNKLQAHSIVIKPAPPYAKDLKLAHPAEETHEFKLESATGQILGYGVGVIYTPLHESTFGAVPAAPGTKRIRPDQTQPPAGELPATLI